MKLRDYGDTADATVIAELERAVHVHRVTTPEIVGWLAANEPTEARARRVVAELDGRVVGVARVALDIECDDGSRGVVEMAVHPEARCRGTGTALLAEAERHLRSAGATEARAWVASDGVSEAFASRRGYRCERSQRIMRLGLGELPEPVPSPPEVDLVTAADFATDPRPLYELDTECVLDEPGDGAIEPIGYDDWIALVWNRPNFDTDLTTVALAGGVPVSFSCGYTDGHDRYFSGMAGTRRDFRGRGLAKLAKGHSLRLARSAGYTEAFATNDASNAPMLAINEWFGYRAITVERRCVRELRPGVPG